MAPFAHGAADSAPDCERGDGLGWTAGTVARAEKSGDDLELGTFSRGAGAVAVVRGEFLLPGLSVYAGTQCGAAIFSSATQLAAEIAQQVAVCVTVCADSILL